MRNVRCYFTHQEMTAMQLDGLKIKVSLIIYDVSSAKLEKEKKQQAKDSGFMRSEVAPQEVIHNIFTHFIIL